MNDSHKELLRRVEELLRASERRIVARFDKPDGAIDSCLAMGGAASSSSTSAERAVSCVAEEPAPASFNPDVSLVVVMDVEDLATPTPARCSIEGPSHDTTELRSASAPATASTTTTATVDIIPVLAAAAGRDGTLDGEATSGVASTPAICSMDCRPRHPMVAPVLNTSSAPIPSEYVLDTNSVHVAVVPWVLSDVSAPPVFALTVPLQQLNNSKVFGVSSSQRITSQVPVHRPMPWPSFMGAHADGDEARPQPWPAFSGINGCESFSDAIIRPHWRCTSDSFPTTVADVEFKVWGYYGNLCTSTSCITINDMCSASESRYLHAMILFLEYGWFGSVRVLLARLLVLVRNLELKILSNGYIPVLTVLLDSGNFAAVTCESLDFPCRSAVTAYLSSPQETGHYFCSSQMEQSLIMHTVKRSNSSYDQFSYAIHEASCWPGNFVTGSKMSIVFSAASTALHWLVPCVCRLAMSSPFSILCDEWVLSPWDSGPQADVTYDQFSGADMGLHCSVICSARDGAVRGSNKLEFKNKVFYTMRQYIDLNSFGIQAALSFFDKSASRALMQGLSHNSKGSYKIDTVLLNYRGFQAAYGAIHVRGTTSFLYDASYSKAVQLYMVDREFFLLQDGISSWADSENMVYAGHAWLFHGFILMCLLAEQLPPTWPPPLACCSIASSMSMDHDLSILAVCEVWLLNHENRMQMLIACSPCVHVGFITKELSDEDNSSCCFFGWYDGRFALFLFLAFDRQVVFQGGRCAMIPIIRYTAHDSNSDFLNSPDSNGLNCDLGGSEILWSFRSTTYQQVILTPTMSSLAWGTTRCALQVTSSELLVFIVVLGGAQGTFQGGRHMPCLNQHKLLCLPWDPGGVASAWGQAEFQGGRGVRDPSYTPPWAGTWAVVMGLATHQQPATREHDYKYARHSNGNGIQKDHGGERLCLSSSLLL